MRTAPFDLEKALAGHPLVTRNGIKVNTFKDDKDGSYYPYTASIDNFNNSYTSKGEYILDEESEHDLLLLLPDEPEQPAKKTVHDYLRELPEPYRSQALEVVDKQIITKEVDSMADAIAWFQVWGNTPQKGRYWNTVHEHYINGTPLPEPWRQEQAKQVKSMPDSVNHPPYYNRGSIEVRDFIQDQELNNCRGNAIKYICRAGFKGDTIHHEIEDLEKAKNNIQAEIDYLKRKHKLN